MQWYYKNGKGELFEEGSNPEGYTDSPDTKVEKPKTVKKTVKKKVK